MCATPLAVFADSFEILQVFDDGLKICVRFGYNPQINCVAFSRM